MTTFVYVEGWEHGVNPTVSGGGIASNVNGTPTVGTATKRSGNYALRIAPAATNVNLRLNALATPTVIVGRINVLFHAWNAVDNDIVFANVTTGTDMGLKIRAASHKIYARMWGGADGGTADVALALDTWYRIDYKFSVAANPTTIDFQVTPDGGTTTTAPQTTFAQAATTFTTPGVGNTNTDTLDMYMDDWVLSTTAGDYPIGNGGVEGISPCADGTHNAGTNIMEDNDGNDIGAVTAFDHVNSVPIGSETVYIRQLANGTANYAEVNFGTTTQETVQGAMAYLAYRAATATANTGGCIIRDEDTTNTTLWGAIGALADYSESSVFYKSKALPNPAGGWDTAAVNALKARMGYSDDANPDPYWIDLMLQVAYATAAGGPSVTPAEGTQTQTGDVAAVFAAYPVTPAEGAQAQTGDAAVVRAAYPVTPAEGAQAQTGDAATVSYSPPVINVTPAEGTQTQTGDTASVFAAYPVTPAEGTQAQAGDAAVVRAGYPITPVDGFQAQTGDIAGVSAAYVLTPAEGNQTQTGDAATVTLESPGLSVTPADGFQTQTSDAAVVSTSYQVTPAKGTQTQVGDAAIVRSGYPVTPLDGFQTQTGDAATVSFTPITGFSVTPGDGFQAQTGDGAVVYSDYPVTPADGYQTQSGDLPAVFADYFINFDQGYQAQLGDLATLTLVTPVAIRTGVTKSLFTLSKKSLSLAQDDVHVIKDKHHGADI